MNGKLERRKHPRGHTIAELNKLYIFDRIKLDRKKERKKGEK